MGAGTRAGRLLKNDASPPGCAGYAQGKDAGSGRSSATDATEDDAWRRPVLYGGRGLVLQQPPGRRDCRSTPEGDLGADFSALRITPSSRLGIEPNRRPGTTAAGPPIVDGTDTKSEGVARSSGP
jgi:hypothetical protein